MAVDAVLHGIEKKCSRKVSSCVISDYGEAYGMLESYDSVLMKMVMVVLPMFVRISWKEKEFYINGVLYCS